MEVKNKEQLIAGLSHYGLYINLSFPSIIRGFKMG